MAQSVTGGLEDLFSSENIEYLLSPKDTGYDIQKTGLYAILLSVAVYFVFLILRKLKVRVDKRLAVAVSPYVVFGSCLRVIKDAGMIDSFLFVTPGIYALIFCVFMGALALSLLTRRLFGIEYHKTAFMIGILLLPFTLSQLDYTRPYAISTVAFLVSPWLILFSAVRWPFENKIVASLHMFDATCTFTALSYYNYYEQHVLPTFFINAFGPLSFLIIKFAAIVTALYLIDRISMDSEFKGYIKLVIGILGAATGTRDFITLAAGV
jgi:uncharacterized membrane protein